VLAQHFVTLFGYPETFNNSVLLIILLSPCLMLASVDTLIGTILATRDRQKAWAMTGLAAAFLNPALNFVAIPFTQSTYANGAIGAAAVTSLTEVFMMVVGLRLMPPRVFNVELVFHGAKCAVVGLIMAGFVWLTRDYPMIVPILTGAAVYGAGCFAVGTLSVAELKQLVVDVAARARRPADAKAERLAANPCP